MATDTTVLDEQTLIRCKEEIARFRGRYCANRRATRRKERGRMANLHDAATACTVEAMGSCEILVQHMIDGVRRKS